MSDEINEDHDDDGEDVGRGKSGNKKGERGEKATFEINRRDSWSQVRAEGGSMNCSRGLIDLRRRQARDLRAWFRGEQSVHARRARRQKVRS